MQKEKQQVPIEGEPLEIICQACGFGHAVDSFYCIACGSPLKGSTSLPNILKPGVRLNDGVYSVGRMLGQGGFGITYLGSDVNAQRPVAIKEFFPSGCARSGSRVVPSGPISPSDFSQARQRFVEEGELLSRFRHPGIVRVFATFEENDTAYIVMELLRGKTLDALLTTRGGRLPEEEAVNYLLKIGDALDIVHKSGLLHRDVKPQNIMVTDESRVVLLDFGTARKYAEGILQKHTVQVTPGYAPLELYSQRALRGPFTDVYSMGATMYYLLSGEPPVPSMDRAVGMPLTNIRKINEDVSENVGSAVMQALNMDWSMRPQEISAFTAMLNGGQPRSPRKTRGDGAEESGSAHDLLAGHTSWVRSLAFSPDGLLLASGSDDKTVRIWNVASMREVRCIKGHTGWVRCLGFAAEPNHVLSGSRDHSVRFWNLLSGGEERRVEAPDGILCLDIAPGGKVVA
ncbi:MAG TPA: serine/threonine-protein kinase, partial [Candidatus Xenobia bacterium]